MTRRLFASLLLTGAAFAASDDPAAPTSVYAEHLETSTRTGESILTGHPYADYGDIRLTADEIRINPQTHTAVATGHATLTRGPRRLVADQISFNAETRTIEVGELRIGQFPVYASGSSATGTPDSLVVNNAIVTLPEPGALVPTLEAARVFFTENRQVRAEDAALGLGRVHPIALPGLSHNVRNALLPSVAVSGGYRRTLGVYIEGSLQIPVTPALRLGGDLGLYTNRGIMAGPSGTYGATHGDNTFFGQFRSGFISDYGTRYTDLIGRRVPRERGFVEWEHLQTIGERLSIAGELNYWSDSEVVRDFRPSDFYNVQQPDTFLESVYSGDNFNVSLFTRFQPNSFQVVQQRLPELRFDLLPTPLGAGINQRFNASIAVLKQDSLPVGPLHPIADPQLRSDRFDAYYGLSRPIAPTNWFAFTPVAGGRVTHYAKATGGRSDYTRVLGEVGFDSELRASGKWDYKNERWKIDGLRHLVTPRLSYRYIPEAEKGARYIPSIDDRSFSTYLQPLGLGDIRNLDELRGTNTLRLGLDQTLQTRDPVYGSRDLVVLNVANDFLFDRRPGERKVSAIHSELAIMPARWLELGVYQSFTPQDFTLQEFNTGITLRDRDDWAVRFASNFLRGELNDYLFRGTKQINEALEAIVHLRYDARRQRFNEQAYGVRQNIGNTWSVEYLITLYDGRRRESNFGFNIRVDVVRY